MLEAVTPCVPLSVRVQGPVTLKEPVTDAALVVSTRSQAETIYMLRMALAGKSIAKYQVRADGLSDVKIRSKMALLVFQHSKSPFSVQRRVLSQPTCQREGGGIIAFQQPLNTQSTCHQHFA